MADKFQISRTLREIALLLQVRGENAFKSRAYDIAAERILGLPDDLNQLVAEERLTEIPGIGPKIAETIKELVQTGKSSHHQKLLEQFGPGALELMQIPELGPKKVAKLLELNLRDVAAVEKACTDGTLAATKGFGEKTAEKVLKNIAVMRRSAGKYRLGSVLPVAEELLQRVKSAPGVIRAELAGSVRRRCETVSDVDLVASAADAKPVLDAFSSHGEVAETLGSGHTKASVRLKTGDIRVDLRVLPDEDFATALHHFTGSKAHHVKLRGLARQKGLTLSEYGLVEVSSARKIPVKDEAELYRALGMPFIPPELREDLGEIEAALAGKLPELVQVEDIQGVVHSHSTWSDGRNSLEEMARAAEAMGFRYLTVTEHSETAFYAGGLKEDDLERQWDEIDSINEKLKTLRLLRGIETDIREDGTLDYDEKLLARLDVVIGSIHQRHKMDEDQMTKRVLKAFDNPCLHVWGHATGRLIHKRDPYPIRMEEVLDKAAEQGIAVEINGNPERLDLKADHVKLALDRGVRLTVSADSHSTRELSYVQYAVDVARRGWATRQHILNTLPLEGFTAAIRRR